MTDTEPMTDTETAARAYIHAVGAHDLAPLDDLLTDDLAADFAGARLDKAGWIGALNRLLPALERNDIREVFANDDRACVVYDFVTRTPAGAVPCVELLTVRGGRISAIELLLDRVAFGPVNAWLADRAVQ